MQLEVNRLVKEETATPKKTNEEIAKEVLQGKWGNGAAREKNLTDAGYNASYIQGLVNKMLEEGK